MRPTPTIDRVTRTRWVVTRAIIGPTHRGAADGSLVVPVTAIAGWARSPLTARLLARRLDRQARSIERGES